eukprot:542596-Rhodomonas_salina.1
MAVFSVAFCLEENLHFRFPVQHAGLPDQFLPLTVNVHAVSCRNETLATQAADCVSGNDASEPHNAIQWSGANKLTQATIPMMQR